MAKYLVRHIDKAPQVVHSSCGESRRVLTAEDNPAVSIHVVHILDGTTHYHKRSSEVYYVLEGSGKLELDGDVVDVNPGVMVFIPPEVRHRGYGDFRTIVVGTPPFSQNDEYFD